MKKLIALALIIMYGATSFGMTLDLNYCCGKLSKVAFSLNQQENFNQDNQFANKKCCDHKAFSFKLKTDHQTYPNQTIDFSTQPIIIPALYAVEFNTNELSKHITCYSTGPPLYSSSCIFIKNCSFRI
ncbi:MAG: hypothetical protein ABJA35_03615 [Parafilimonas sp.]